MKFRLLSILFLFLVSTFSSAEVSKKQTDTMANFQKIMPYLMDSFYLSEKTSIPTIIHLKDGKCAVYKMNDKGIFIPLTSYKTASVNPTNMIIKIYTDTSSSSFDVTKITSGKIIQNGITFKQLNKKELNAFLQSINQLDLFKQIENSQVESNVKISVATHKIEDKIIAKEIANIRKNISDKQPNLNPYTLCIAQLLIVDNRIKNTQYKLAIPQDNNNELRIKIKDQNDGTSALDISYKFSKISGKAQMAIPNRKSFEHILTQSSSTSANNTTTEKKAVVLFTVRE